MRLTTILLVGLFTAPAVVAAEDPGFMTGMVLKQNLTGTPDGFYRGYVFGLVDMMSVEGTACIPDGVSIDQTIAVVKQFLDQNPSRLHEPALSLAATAVHDAWPCAKKGK